MKIQRKITPILIVAIFAFAAHAASAQDTPHVKHGKKAVETTQGQDAGKSDETPQPMDSENAKETADAFNPTVLKEKLYLNEEQTQHIQNVYEEMKQRIKDESEAMKDNPEEGRRRAIELRQETQDRIREVLMPDQAEKFDAIISKEKSRQKTEIDGDMHEHHDDDGNQPE